MTRWNNLKADIVCLHTVQQTTKWIHKHFYNMTLIVIRAGIESKRMLGYWGSTSYSSTPHYMASYNVLEWYNRQGRAKVFLCNAKSAWFSYYYWTEKFRLEFKLEINLGLLSFQFFRHLQKMRTGRPFQKIVKLQKCRNYYVYTYIYTVVSRRPRKQWLKILLYLYRWA